MSVRVLTQSAMHAMSSMWRVRTRPVIGARSTLRSTPTAALLVLLLACAASSARAQREFVEEIDPDEGKKSSINAFDLDAPDPARPSKKPDAGPARPLDKQPEKRPERGAATRDAGPEPAGAPGDSAGAADAGPVESVDGGTPSVAEDGFAITVLETSRDAFLEKWDARGAAVRKGEAARAKKMLADIEGALLDHGVQGLPAGVQAPAAAQALIVEAQRALEEGSLESALALVEVAGRAAPDLVAVHTAQAKVAWRAGDVGKTMNALAASVSAHSRDPLALTAVLARVVWVVGAALLAVLALFATFAGLRALRYLAFDLGSFLPKGAHPGQVLALVVLIAIAPLFLGVGPVFGALFVLGLTWMYLARTERIVVAILGVACVALPLLVTLFSQLVSYPGSRADRAQRALTSIDADDDRRSIAALAPEARTVIEEGALALELKRNGKVDEARAAFEAIVKKHGDERGMAWVHGELGVLAAIKDDSQIALQELGKAIASDQRLSAASFNSSMIHFRAGDTRRAEEAVNGIVQADPELLASYRRTTYRAPDEAVAHNRAFVDVMPTPLAVLRADLSRGQEAGPVEAAIARSLLRGQTGQRALGVLGAFPLVFMLAFALRKKLQPARACARCGDPASQRRDGPNVPEDTCGQCYHAFVSTRSRIDAGVKLRKERAITNRARRVSRSVLLLTLLFPGAGHIYCAAAARGALFATLWAIGLGALALALDMWPMPRLAGPWGQVPALVACGAYLLIVWVLALKSSFNAAEDAVSTRRK